jgi:hypothetical protein
MRASYNRAKPVAEGQCHFEGANANSALEGLFLLEKMRFAKSFMEIPRKIAKDIEQINVL